MSMAVLVYLLSLTGALYLLRGMIEFPQTGWRPEVKLTVGVGVVLLPLLAALAASAVPWGRWIIIAMGAAGALVNGVLLVRLWRGVTAVSLLTILIVLIYAAVVLVALVSGSSPASSTP